MSNEQAKIIILTGKPADGKTTIGRLMEKIGFKCIEGDDFITPVGKIRLNNGVWNDTDRKLYLTRMAANAVESAHEHSKIVIADCLTTQWMREFLSETILNINSGLAIGFILVERELDDIQVRQIAKTRSKQGHALDVDALITFRKAFEPWDPKIPCVKLTNPGDGDTNKLLSVIKQAIDELWN